MKCSKCGSRDIDFQESIGQSICVACGTVLEENTIVSSIEFQESGDRSHVVGQYISASCSKPYSGGRPIGGHGESRDPRDATLVNARRAITQVAGSLRLPPLYTDRAYRLYQLALQRNFIFGRKQLHVVATCLYIICRQEKSPHLLIDFSDALQVNVYVLGKSFLQFSKVLNLNLPVVDPSLYIHRYATRLDLGDARASVVATSLRIITRLKKDWITTGRRPDGICALAMLVSARAHDFDVNQDVICKLFRVSPDLLRRRIEDFRSIPSAQLTLEQFHTNDTEVEFDPPAYIRNVLREASSNNARLEDAYGYSHGSSSSSNKRVRLALPTEGDEVMGKRRVGAGVGSSVNALVAAANLELSKSIASSSSSGGGGKRVGFAEQKNGQDASDSEAEQRGSGDEEDVIMRDPENLISDSVFQQQHSNGTSGGRRLRSAGAGGGDQSDSDSEGEDGLRRQGYSTVGGDVYLKTKIADINIVVPVPGQRKRRRLTDNAMLRIQQRKDLYEDVYQEVLLGCEQSASDVGVQALREEAQTIEDASYGVGGWGDNTRQTSRIRERRIVMCVDNAAVPTSSGGKTAAGKIKFRRVNNGADASYHPGVTVEKVEPSAAAKGAGSSSSSASAEARTAAKSTEATTAVAAEVQSEEEVEVEEDVLGGELGRYLLTEEEQEKRKRIWDTAFGTFMKEREDRRQAREREQASSGANEKYTQGGKLRRKYTRKAIAAAAGGAGAASGAATTTSQAVMQAQQSRSSKKINYDALKGVFNPDGGFAAPAAATGAASARGGASAADRSSSQAYLDSIMGISIPGLPGLPSSAPSSFPAGTGASSGFQKDVRKTLLGSSIVKTNQTQREAAAQKGSLLTAGTALSKAIPGGARLGPADVPSLAAKSAMSGASSAAAVSTTSAAAAAAQEDMLEGDDGEEDQLLYEGGGGEEGDYDDYDDEYY